MQTDLRKKFRVLKMYGEDYEFTYERPEMLYDKKTGDVHIL